MKRQGNSFLTPLIVSPMPDGRRWKLYRSFTYRLGKGYIRVPSGFVTDFASIPWVFWQFLPKWGKYGKAAVVHDWLYNISMIRKDADDIFLEAMLVSGTKPWKAKVMYLAVRWFGWIVWRKR